MNPERGPIISPPTPSHPAQNGQDAMCSILSNSFYPLVLIMYRKPRITRYLINPNMEDENPALKHSLVETETIQT